MDQAPPEFNRLKDCRYGRMLYNVNDLYVGRSLDLYGEFSEGEIDLFRQIVRPGDVVMDLGANIGAFTVFFARAVGSAGAVIAVEPQRLAFQTLCANVALNNLINVHCVHAACGASPGALYVPTLDPTRRQNFGGLRVTGHATGEVVPVMRADTIPVPSLRLIKVDVEGMELDVLKGCTSLLDRFSPPLYVENDRPESRAELIRYIDSLGYDQFWHQPPLFNPQNYAGCQENVFGTVVSGNMLCLKRGTYTHPPAPRVEVPQA